MNNYISAKAILKQLIWDHHLNRDAFNLVFIDRGANESNMTTISCTDLTLYQYTFGMQKRDPDTWAWETAEIPYHRIIKIFNTKTSEVLFEKQPSKTSGVKLNDIRNKDNETKNLTIKKKKMRLYK